MRRRRYLKAGNLDDLRRRWWAAILEVSDLIEDQDCPPERVLRAGHCLSALANTYKAVVEVSDLEGRIRQLELAAERNGHGLS